MKRTHLYILASLFLQSLTAEAQSFTELSPRYEAVIQSVVAQNTSLKAVRQQNEAERLRLQASQRLPDPEAEVAYLVGSPNGVPNRTNVTVTQQLDWGVLTGRRKDAAKAGGEVLALGQAAAAREVREAADCALVELVYRNKMCLETRRRAETAQEIFALYGRKYAQGEISLPDLNKARLSASVARAAAQRAETERKEAEAAIALLAGGADISYPDTVYGTLSADLPPLPQLLSQAQSSSAVALANGAVRQSLAERDVAKAEAWPALTAGFMGEYIKNNNYSGISLGFSLPLWGGGRKRVKQAEAQTLARQIEADGVRTRLQAAVSRQYQSAADLLLAESQLRESLAETDNAALLRRSLDEGRISLLEYLTETAFYYDARTAQLEAERDAQTALARLRALLR